MATSQNLICPAEHLTKLEYAAIEIFLHQHFDDDDEIDIDDAVEQAINASVVLLNKLEDYQRNLDQ